MEPNIAHKLEGVERTKDVQLKELMPFSKMILTDWVRRGLQKAGFVYPTVIQATAIPVGKSGIDLLIQSKSGTGKTLIFCTILLEAYRSDVFEPQALIVAPTREIAVQIETVLNQIGSCSSGFRAVCVIGGLDVSDDRKRLQGAKAVVGTPGRVLHLIQNDVLNTSQIKLLVLDEADKMYSQTFRQDLQRIQKALPAKRQTIACSATFCGDLDKELAKIMRNPLLISTEERATLLVGIKQFVYELPEQKTSIMEMQAKLDGLRDIFGRISFRQCLIFAGSQSRADSYRNYLEKEGWPCELISGAQDQKTRLEMFKKFREFKTRIIIATDLMSRGVDSEYVNLVINLELPTDVVTYLHRIGRAGRFGSHGIAISFVASEKDRCTLTRLITQVGSGMNVLKYPKKGKDENDKIERDFWDFTNFDEESKYFGIFGSENVAPLASQDCTSLTDSNENKENQKCVENTNSVENSNSSIDTKTFCVDSKDSAMNVLDSIIDRPDHNLQVHNQKLTPNSQRSSSMQLPSSNTIDDASSIAADSLRSSQQDISRYQSVLMHKAAIPTLFEFLVDQKSTDKGGGDGCQQKKKKNLEIDLFEDYKKTVLNNIDTSTNETEDKSEGPQLTCQKLVNVKSLLIDKPTQPEPETKEKKDIYSDYVNFNADEESSSISQPTDTAEMNKSTFTLSVATPSNVQKLFEEFQNSFFESNQNGSSSDNRDLSEVKHFTSPAHNQPTSSIPDVVPSRQNLPLNWTKQQKKQQQQQRLEQEQREQERQQQQQLQKQQKLTVNVAAQIEIPPYPRVENINPIQQRKVDELVRGENENEHVANGEQQEPAAAVEGDSDAETIFSGSDWTENAAENSSGFNERTGTSASSGIETSEVGEGGESYEMNQSSIGAEEDIYEDGDDSYEYEDDEEYVESDEGEESDTETETDFNQPSTSAGLRHRNRRTTSRYSRSRPTATANDKWVDMYWNQLTLITNYVHLTHSMRQRNE